MNDLEFSNNRLAEERTLLAAERTFSAWLRTALAAMGGGLAVLRLISFKSDVHKIIAHFMGETLILWGFLVIILSSLDYKRMHNKLIINNYKSSTWGFIMMVFPLLIISILLIWVTWP